jgi:Uma2 family endonuclease
MILAAPALRRWTRDEYYKMAGAGIFAPGERVELIEGEIIAMTPQDSPHATAGSLAEEALRGAFGPEFHVRSQRPLNLGQESEPEPDAAVVRGRPRDYVHAHPTTAVLVVEISDTTLAFDRGPKAALYARAGIPEYWIVNLVDRVLEVHRDPGPLPHAPAEYSFRSILRLGPAATVNPLQAPAATVRIADLLP